MTAKDACCACDGITPSPESPTCQDLEGWTTTDNRTCSEVTKLDCYFSTESYGIPVGDACCKCEARADNPNAPTDIDFPTTPYTAGLCASDSTRFNICMKISPKVAPRDIPLFSAAESIWSSVIVEDSPQFEYNFETINTTGYFSPFGESPPQNISGLSEFYQLVCGFDPEFPSDNTIDDINICANQGYYGVSFLGYGATVFADNFARFGVMSFNANAIGGLRNTSNGLQNLISHNIGELWSAITSVL